MSDQNVSDDAVAAATGANWSTWFQRLQDDGCTKMDHANIALHVATRYNLTGWWAQMVTVQFERAAGLRDVNQAPSGWQFSKQRTVSLSVEQAFEAVQSLPDWRALIVGEEVDLGFGSCTVRRVDHQLIRLWIHEPSGKSVLEIGFTPKGDKTAVLFAHSAIPRKQDMAAWKKRWADLLEQL